MECNVKALMSQMTEYSTDMLNHHYAVMDFVLINFDLSLLLCCIVWSIVPSTQHVQSK